MKSLFLTNTTKPLSEVVAIALSIGCLTAGGAEAASFTFSKIVGQSNNQQGIYTNPGGMLQTVVDTNTPVPLTMSTLVV